MHGNEVPADMKLIDYLNPELIFLDLPARSKEEALAEIARSMTQAGAVKSECELLNVISQRESQGSTSLGNGVAIPHARLKCLEKITLAMARVAPGIDFGGEGHPPVQLIFLLLTPVDKAAEYLKVLARLSKLMKENDLPKSMKKIPSPQAAWEFFASLENQEIH